MEMKLLVKLNQSHNTSVASGSVKQQDRPFIFIIRLDIGFASWILRLTSGMSEAASRSLLRLKALILDKKLNAAATVSALNSSLFYWWFLIMSDCRHLNLREIEYFPLGLDRMSKDMKARLAKLTDQLMEDFNQHKTRKETLYQTTGKVIYDEFNQKPSKPIVDEIDRVLAEHFGFTDEELDFIINYDIKYRMGL